MLLKLYGGQQFNPLVYSPALWLDASDPSTLIMDGARTFASASSQSMSCVSNTSIQAGGADWMWAGWYNPTTVAATSTIIGKYTDATNNDFTIEVVGTTGHIRSYVFSSGGTVGAASSTGNTGGTWKFFCVYYDGTAKKTYSSVNGEAFTASAAHTGTAYSSSADLKIGGPPYYNGKLDSLCFFKPTSGWLASNATALRDYLYNGGSGRRSSDFISSALYSGSGAVSWWDMDARSGNETDRIGSNNLTDNGGVGYAAGVASGLVQYTGDPVKQWSDKSGNARHVTAASDAARFTYATNSQNGLSGATSDAINDMLSVANFMDNVTVATLYMVAKHSSGFPAIGTYNGLTDGGVYLYYASATQARFEGRPLVSGSYSTVVNSPSGSITASDANVLCGTYDASTGLQVYVNGTAGTAGNQVSTNSGGYSSLSVGPATAAGGSYGAGTFYELAVFLEVHDATKRNNMTRYLGNKWGITVP